MIESLVQPDGFLFQHTSGNFDSGFTQDCEPTAAVAWIGICSAGNHMLDAGLDNRGGAWRSSSESAAWLEADVERRAAGGPSLGNRGPQGFDFGVRFASPMMPAFPENHAVLYEHCSDHWVGRSRSFRCQPQRAAHESCISGVAHF